MIGLLLASAGPAVASDHPGTVAVDLEADGDAAVTISYRFDLTTTAERQAFEELRTDEAARADYLERFEDRLRAVADATANATGRDVAVSDVGLRLRTEGETGIVEVRAAWTNLPAVDGTQLTVTEPFASGFETERPLRIVGPEDASIASVSPSPDDRSGTTLIWDGGTDLTGLDATFEVEGGTGGETAGGDTPDGDPTAGGGGSGDGQAGSTDTGGPGFGVAAALIAIGSLALLARRHR